MAKINSVCVFCGAAEGTDPAFTDAASELGTTLGEASIGLIYGGARIGIMGTLARSALRAGSHVTGIIPGHIHEIEPSMDEVHQLVLVDTMHERKMMMFEGSDAFVVLPGGIGTLDETIELLTWRQLGLHGKPVVLINISGFWNPFVGLLEHLIEARFAPKGVRDIINIVDTVGDVLPLLHALPEPELRPKPIVYYR